MDYEKQARDFLETTGTGFDCEFLRQGKYFPDDEYERDIYRITLTKDGRYFSFEFGQSYNASGKWWKYGKYQRGIYTRRDKQTKKVMYSRPFMAMKDWDLNKNFAEPTAYDVLAVLTKDDPYTFADFCASYGYDEDSKQAEKTYIAVVAEYKHLERLFNEEEMEMLREIR